MARFLTSFLLTLTSLETVKAAPKAYPEVIPGPGLASLKELNLTSTQLYEMGPPDAGTSDLLLVASISPPYVPKCGPADAAYANVNDIIAAFNLGWFTSP
ncbi:hypothetical protein NEMBOFW57_010555 [Staphylotrichum longicolle]|uniref:Uncharacterized protein n=1 Tax=Staphylotrichum longicolle TaxID=669026 RepID=A0AAD4HUD8_9PEZI|nr:hypothetical protein NEMBOFW57_010555 [Staphylotrichum longicolle]